MVAKGSPGFAAAAAARALLRIERTSIAPPPSPMHPSVNSHHSGQRANENSLTLTRFTFAARSVASSSGVSCWPLPAMGSGLRGSLEVLPAGALSVRFLSDESESDSGGTYAVSAPTTPTHIETAMIRKATSFMHHPLSSTMALISSARIASPTMRPAQNGTPHSSAHARPLILPITMLATHPTPYVRM